MEGSETTSPVPEEVERKGLGAVAVPFPASVGLLPAGDVAAVAGDAVPGADDAPPDHVLPAVPDGTLPIPEAADAGLADAEDGVWPTVRPMGGVTEICFPDAGAGGTGGLPAPAAAAAGREDSADLPLPAWPAAGVLPAGALADDAVAPDDPGVPRCGLFCCSELKTSYPQEWMRPAPRPSGTVALTRPKHDADCWRRRPARHPPGEQCHRFERNSSDCSLSIN